MTEQEPEPYIWGGAQPEPFDCAALVEWALAQDHTDEGDA